MLGCFQILNAYHRSLKEKKILYMALFEFGNGDWHEGNIHSKGSNVCDL